MNLLSLLPQCLTTLKFFCFLPFSPKNDPFRQTVSFFYGKTQRDEHRTPQRWLLFVEKIAESHGNATVLPRRCIATLREVPCFFFFFFFLVPQKTHLVCIGNVSRAFLSTFFFFSSVAGGVLVEMHRFLHSFCV